MGYGGRRCGRDTLKPAKDETDEQRKARERRADQSHNDELLRDPNHKDDADIKAVVDAYREANPMVKVFWYELQRKFWSGGTVGAGRVHVRARGSSRFIHLPSGRTLAYHGVCKVKSKRIVDEVTGDVIEEGGRWQLAYRHTRGYLEKTYGGRLTENVTQAVARDLLVDAMLRLDAAGYPIVGHVHDEALVESADADGIREIMRTGPGWAEGLPMDASATYLHRYRKD
jgi:DNA polymerase